jgi:phosphoenolpyruvate carboxykinase (GTP)
MLPFCGYNMGDYFQHWIGLGKRMTPPPKVFHVNWFKKDKQGHFLWPGFSDNLRVLEWVVRRCRHQVDARKTPIGYVPHDHDLDLTGLKLQRNALKELFSVRKKEWQLESEGIKEFFGQFGRDLPEEMHKELRELKKRLQ